jgi:hypothetical protein
MRLVRVHEIANEIEFVFRHATGGESSVDDELWALTCPDLHLLSTRSKQYLRILVNQAFVLDKSIRICSNR